MLAEKRIIDSCTHTHTHTLTHTHIYLACWVERQTRDRKVPTGAAEEFSSPELISCADSYSLCEAPVILANVQVAGYT